MEIPDTIAERKLNVLSASTVSALCEVDRALHANGLPADITLRKIFRQNHQFGSRDRHFITSAVFAFYRWYGWLSKAFPEEKTGSIRMLAAAFLLEGEMPLTASVWCRELSIVQQDYGTWMDQPDCNVRLSAFSGRKCQYTWHDLLPDRITAYLADGAEENYLPFLSGRPPVWIRIQKNEAAVLSEFSACGITAEKDSRLPHAFCLGNHKKINLQLLESYKKGYFEIQDFASQCIGYAAAPDFPESHLWDACAGGGGKTLLLASLLGNKGRVTASDVREKKLEETAQRAARGGFRNVDTCLWDQAVKKTYDGVLVDAPCTSSGRWRRNPEMKWIITEQWIHETSALQLEILTNASRQVKPGGFLVYGTCSVFREENTEVVDRFLKANPNFSPEPFSFAGQSTAALQLFPSVANCDGTFCARFHRRK